jgi:hypothetical protein
MLKVHLGLRPFLVVCLGLILAACGSQDSLLNSERIEKTFGSYGVDILQSDNEGRVSSLYSGSGDDKITRTFAVVRFSGRIRRAFAGEHAEVQSGRSIGAVFKAADWQIEKINIFVGEMEVPAKYGLLSELMQVDLPKFLAAHVYEFVIKKEGRSYEYATIVELHHPAYLSAEDLQAIYGEIVFDDSNRTSIDDYIDPNIWRN